MTLDPKQTFVLLTCTRQEIVNDLEYAREDGYRPNIALTPEDERLTDEFCQEYATEMGKIYEDAPSEDEDWFLEARGELGSVFLQKLGYELINIVYDGAHDG